jgi:Protein of unknown function (DUF1345)
MAMDEVSRGDGLPERAVSHSIATTTARVARSSSQSNQQLGEGARRRVAVELAAPVDPLVVGEREDVLELGAGGGTERVQTARGDLVRRPQGSRSRALGFALLQASDQSGVARALTTAVAVATVVLSWLAVQTVFTLRYAHLYYLDGGIDFHNERAPDYGDFAYVAFTLGMTYQVSDTDLTSKRIRTTALRQAVLSYVFGISVIAITINAVAGLLHR